MNNKIAIIISEVKREMEMLDEIFSGKLRLNNREYTQDEYKFFEGMNWAYYRIFKMLKRLGE
jgi:hypothetical protein